MLRSYQIPSESTKFFKKSRLNSQRNFTILLNTPFLQEKLWISNFWRTLLRHTSRDSLHINHWLITWIVINQKHLKWKKNFLNHKEIQGQSRKTLVNNSSHSNHNRNFPHKILYLKKIPLLPKTLFFNKKQFKIINKKSKLQLFRKPL